MSTSMHLSRLRRWFLASPPIEFAISGLRALLISALRQGPVPQHIAFVMDGNRRFARSHGIETVEGHNLGFEALARILEVCYKSGVKVVTIYAFSIENFKRSKLEVDALMEMARVKLSQMAQHGDLLDRFGARVRVLGRLDLLKPDVLAAANRAAELTSGNGDRVLNICFPYTSRDEITTAIRETVADYSEPLKPAPPAPASLRAPFSESHIALNIRARALNVKAQDLTSDAETSSESSALLDEDRKTTGGTDSAIYGTGPPLSSTSTLDLEETQVDGPEDLLSLTANTCETNRSRFASPETISRETISDRLFTKGNPPLDLLIRTSGVRRLSDFMLWQCDENTEIAFLDVLWPEFDLWHFLPVLLGWQRKIMKLRKNPDAESNFDGSIIEPYEAGMNGQGQKNIKSL